jgi:hypothetical protein
MAISGLLGLFLIALAPVALATTVEECVGLIEELDTALDGVEIRGRHPAQTRASLESKLGGASTKTNQAKFCAAIGKLDDFESKVGDLAVANRKGETKMDPADAAMLQADAAEAISCLLDLDPSCL